MQLSIIVLTWNSAAYIGTFLQSIVESIHLPVDDYEIFVVDNGSTDQTPSLIEEYRQIHGKLITPILLDTNRGTTYSRNLGLKKASGEFVAIMDCDIEINDQTFSYLIKALREDKKTGLVAPRLVYASGALQKSTDQFPTLLHKAYRYLFLKHIESKENRSTIQDKTRQVDYAISAFWLFRRQLLSDIGLLDERFFYAPEDVDFCLRVWKNGQHVLYVPEASAIHYAQEISRGLAFNKAQLEHLRGLLYFFTKHRYLFRKPSF